ncbi:helix-turn-helix domain-containing protein [candidate division NPL-UPA2 bacterium]|nr:helix-turn-helix domain-containing protein [candidate division NPL-UPA2 bacterium]
MDIKNCRQRIGVSQKVLAKEAEVSYRTVLRFEKGGHIRDEKLEKIISALEKLGKSGQSLSPWWLKRL